MNPTVASALVTALGLVVVALITQRQNRKATETTNRLSERVVDREDFQTVVKELRTSLAEVRAELETEVAERRKADERATAAEVRAMRAEQRADNAERRATRLELRVTQLERVLRENEIEVPPVP